MSKIFITFNLYIFFSYNTDLILSMCHLLEWPPNRCFFGNENGVIILLKLIAGTNPIHKELAINTLFHFEFCKEILVVCIII